MTHHSIEKCLLYPGRRNSLLHGVHTSGYSWRTKHLFLPGRIRTPDSTYVLNYATGFFQWFNLSMNLNHSTRHSLSSLVLINTSLRFLTGMMRMNNGWGCGCEGDTRGNKRTSVLQKYGSTNQYREVPRSIEKHEEAQKFACSAWGDSTFEIRDGIVPSNPTCVLQHQWYVR